MESIWSKTWNRKKYPSLDRDIHTDAAVIGGGMAGILTAWYLEQAGVRTVVLEADRIGGGQTKNTTAKITAQHGLFCSRFMKKKGEETARKYVQANQSAVEEYKRIIRDKGIDCDLRECDSYVYSADREKIRREVQAAKRLGIQACIEDHLEIPVSCAGAVRFPRQAEFHPLKFIGALAGDLTVYENTRAVEIEDHLIKTTGGNVSAGQIIIAAQFPFLNFPGMYFARMYQERSYVLALSNAGRLNGMYIGDEKEMFSFRQYDQYILLGGQAHRTGENQDGGQYEALKKSAKEMFPKSTVAACWSNQDGMPADSIPFIGRFAADRPNWFVAAGFHKWGMSSSMVSAMLLKDLICGKQNEFAEIFTPSRFSGEEIPGIMRQGGEAAKGLAKRFFHVPHETTASLAPGCGGIIKTPKGKAGGYKTETGKIYQVDVVCPHMGCELAWNPEECSWDCPCHGSRFDREGNLLNGPAQRGIKYEA